METKTFKLKLNEVEEGRLSGYLAIFKNIDQGGDMIEPGAFSKTLSEKKNFPLLWAHSSLDPRLVVGTFSAREDEHGLFINAEFFTDLEGGRNAYNVIRRLHERNVKVGLSCGYIAVKAENKIIDGKSVRVLKEINLYEGSLTLFPMNPLAQITDVKAEWDVAYINELPDAAFAVIEPAYKKGDTEDKRARHLPHHNKSVKRATEDESVDLPHLRNALARMNQIKPISDSISTAELRSQAKEHLEAHAKRLGVGEHDSFDFDVEKKPYPNHYACRLHEPDEFERFVTITKKYEGKRYNVILGFREDGSSEEQSYHYPIDEWEREEVKKHCKENNGRFEDISKSTIIECRTCGEKIEVPLEPQKSTREGAEIEPEFFHSQLQRIAANLKGGKNG